MKRSMYFFCLMICYLTMSLGADEASLTRMRQINKPVVKTVQAIFSPQTWHVVAVKKWLEAERSRVKKKICLNMIVKNESQVITRCLASVKPMIDYWVILDTGSTDGTQDIIKQYMKDIPGELHEEPFVNFEYSRNKALDFARGKSEYLLFIDADEVLSIAPDFKLPHLDHDFYYIMTQYGGTEYVRVQLIKNEPTWHWEGVVHEAVVNSLAHTCSTLEGVKNIVNTDGARSKDPRKYQKDAAMLEEALAKDPTSTRYTFYLAQSYKDAGEHAKALEFYQKRIAMGGWDQEVFWSMLQVAHLQQALDRPSEDVLSSYYQAYHYRNLRMEPIYYLANYYRQKGDFAAGYLIANVGRSLRPSKDILFVEKWIYDYGLLLELSICAYWIGKYDECQVLSEQILAKQNIPDNVRECVERNLSFARTKLVELYQHSHSKEEAKAA